MTRYQYRAMWVGAIIGWLALGIPGGLLGGKWLFLWVPGAIVGGYVGYRGALPQRG